MIWRYMVGESDEDKRRREKEAIGDFRSFLASYRQAVAAAYRGFGDIALMNFRGMAEDGGRVVLKDLLGRWPTDDELKRCLELDHGIEKSQEEQP
jgi:hypothetical protein